MDMRLGLIGEYGSEMVIPIKVHKIKDWLDCDTGIVTIPPEVPNIEHVDLCGFFGAFIEWTDVETLRKIFRQNDNNMIQAPKEKEPDYAATSIVLRKLSNATPKLK